MRALVVDDDPGILEVITLALIGEGCNVDTARNGDEALAVLADHVPDVVILDLRMPVVSGFDVLTLARYFSDRPLPRTVGMTADPAAARKLRQQGYRCLDKPFDLVELLEAVGVYSSA